MDVSYLNCHALGTTCNISPKYKEMQHRGFLFSLPTSLWNKYWYINQTLFSRYVEQLVASAEAAVEEVIRRGVSFVILFPEES